MSIVIDDDASERFGQGKGLSRGREPEQGIAACLVVVVDESPNP